MKPTMLFFILFFISGCATTDQYHINAGNRLYKEGKIEEAANHFIECGKNRNAVCIYNLAYIFEGYGETGYAIQFYTMSSKLGNDFATRKLIQYNAEVPARISQNNQSNDLEDTANTVLKYLNVYLDSKNKAYKNNQQNNQPTTILLID